MECNSAGAFLPHPHYLLHAKFEFDAGLFYGNEHLTFAFTFTCTTTVIVFNWNVLCAADGVEENCPMALAFRFHRTSIARHCLPSTVNTQTMAQQRILFRTIENRRKKAWTVLWLPTTTKTTQKLCVTKRYQATKMEWMHKRANMRTESTFQNEPLPSWSTHVFLFIRFWLLSNDCARSDQPCEYAIAERL